MSITFNEHLFMLLGSIKETWFIKKNQQYFHYNAQNDISYYQFSIYIFLMSR